MEQLPFTEPRTIESQGITQENHGPLEKFASFEEAKQSLSFVELDGVDYGDHFQNGDHFSKPDQVNWASDRDHYALFDMINICFGIERKELS